MRYLSLCLILFLLPACTDAEAPDPPADAEVETMEPDVQTEEVAYTAGGLTMQGYLAYDANQDDPRPGILVVHEWWGHNEYARRRARMLAELGYTALAVDMYGEGKTADHPDDAGAFAQAALSDLDAAQARFEAAMEVLQNHPTVEAEQIAAIGYCFGGAVVLNMARRGVDLDGVVSFHGSLDTQEPAQPGAITSRILVLHGAADPFIPPEAVARFRQEMDAAGASYEFIEYPGATHSFTSPEADSAAARFDMPVAYHPEADAESWQAMQDFFNTIFD